MEKQIEVLAFHGWGFDGSVWNVMQKKLSDKVLFKKADRGYFGKELPVRFTEPKAIRIVLTHSFGLHWCPQEILSDSNYNVIFNGFDRFLPQVKGQKERRRKILQRMRETLEDDPVTLLKQFYSNAGCSNPGSIKREDIQVGKLKDDLKEMQSCQFKSTNDSKVKWVIIDSATDRIAPGERGKEIVHQLPDAAYFVIQTSDHIIPLTKSEECLGILYRSIPIFRDL